MAAKSASLSADSFEKLGVHPNVCRAFASKGIHAPYPQQAAALDNTARDMCDVLATVKPHTGRHTLLIGFAAHCVLAASVPKFSLVIANTASSCTKLSNVASMLNINGVSAHSVLDASDRARTSGCVTPSLVVTTLATALKWPREEFLKCAALLVEDAAQCGAPDDLVALMQTVANAADPLNMFLLTTQSLPEVPAAVRYALHRRRRRFCPLQPLPPSFTFLLAMDNDDRMALLRKIVQIKPLKRLLVLTHSKEVKDLKVKMQQWGLNTFALSRNAPPSEQTATIRSFAAASYSVLVAADAYAGLDMLDVDAVVQYYPPQKSMAEEEWADFVRCLRTTCHPTVPTRFITLLGTDDFTLGAYFMKRAECDGPILNITPNHPRFADAVLHPVAVAMARVNQPLPAAIEFPKANANAKSGGKSGNNTNSGNNNNNSSAKGNNANTNANTANNNAASEKEKQRQREREKELQRQKDREREAQRQKEKEKEKEREKEKEKNAAASPNGSGSAEDGELSNRAKRRLAKEEARKKQDAAVKQKEENRAKEAQRLKEKAAREEAAKKKSTASTPVTQSPADVATPTSPDSPNPEGKSKRQLRKESYYAESKQRSAAKKE